MPSSPCPEPSRLKDLLDGNLPEAEQLELNQHLESCQACQRTLESLVAGGESWSRAARQLNETQATPEPALQEAMAGLKGGRTETHFGEGTAEGISLDFLTPTDQPNRLGKLDHYEIIEVIGKGGFGVVLKAFDPELHRHVAIKVLSPHLATSTAARMRFKREAKAAAAVTHEHVVAIHGVADITGLPYLVMQYVAGMSLQERIDRDGPLQVKEILRIGMQAARGLAAAHAQGTVHRDIKPANILLENGVERVKISDFGLARAVDDASVTQSGVIAGTPQYMSPEQARGESVDHRTDLFSLGSVLYAMCTGRPPFRASTTMGVLKRVSDDTPRAIRQINPDIPEWLEAIIQKLHAKERGERFQSAGEVAELLGQHLAHLQQPGVVPMPAPVRSERPSLEDRLPEAVPARRRFTGRDVAAVSLLIAFGLFIAMMVTLEQTKSVPLGLLVFFGPMVMLLPLLLVFLRKRASDRGASLSSPFESSLQKPSPPLSATDHWSAWCLGSGFLVLLAGLLAVGALGEWSKTRPSLSTLQAWVYIATGVLPLLLFGPGLLIARRLARRNPATPARTMRYVFSAGLGLGMTAAVMALLWARAPNLQANLRNLVIDPYAYLHLDWETGDFDSVIVEGPGSQERYGSFQNGVGTPVVAGPYKVIGLKGGNECAEERFTLEPKETRHVTLAAWRGAAKSLDISPPPDSGYLREMILSPDGRTLARYWSDGKLIVMDVDSGKERFKRGAQWPALAFSPDSRTLALIGTKGIIDLGVILVDAVTGDELAFLKLRESHFSDAEAMAFSPDGKTVAVSSAYNTDGKKGAPLFRSRIWRWELASGKQLPTLEWQDNSIHALAFTGDSQFLISAADRNGEVIYWKNGVKRAYAGREHTASRLAISPDGRELASARYDPSAREDDRNTVTIRRAEDYLGRQLLRGHRYQVQALAFSADGRYLATGDCGMGNKETRPTIRVWDAQAGKLKAVLLGHTDWIMSLAFVEGGRRLVSASKDHTIKWWDLSRVVAPSTTPQPSQPPPVESKLTDHGRIQGTWNVVSAEYKGTPVPVTELKQMEWMSFMGERLVACWQDQIWHNTFRLDPSKEPKEIDTVAGDDVVRGIYQLDGDQLKIARSLPPDGARPTSFTAGPSDNVLVLKLHRHVAPTDGFVLLFNGRDLTGWKKHPEHPGNWRVEGGTLVGSGGPGYLFTDRDDYGDFHLRAEMRINDGDSGIFFRVGSDKLAVPRQGIPVPQPLGYEAQISSRAKHHKTGTLYGSEPAVILTESPIRPGEWFVLEVITIDNRIITKVNGNLAVDVVDPKRFTRGAFALQVWDAETEIQVRKVEIKELPGASDSAAAVPAKAKSDEELLHGTWVVTGYELGGAKKDRVAELKLVIDGEKLKYICEGGLIGETPTVPGVAAQTLRSLYFRDRGGFHISARETPKEITFFREDRGVTLRGIYRLDGDLLTLCLDASERPKTLATSPEQPARVLVRLKRVGQADVKSTRPAESDPAAVAGVWDSDYGRVTLLLGPRMSHPQADAIFAVTGSWYDEPTNFGRVLNGRYNPAERVLVFEYDYEGDPKSKGTATMTLSADGATLLGGYFEEGEIGTWNMQRRPNSSPQLAAELAKLQGDWAIRPGEQAGQPLPTNELLKALGTASVVGDQWRIRVEGQPVVGIVKIDPAKQPKAIDFEFVKAPEKTILGKVIRGIYQLEGNVLTLCVNQAGGDRPAEFVTKSDVQFLIVTQRQATPTPRP